MFFFRLRSHPYRTRDTVLCVWSFWFLQGIDSIVLSISWKLDSYSTAQGIPDFMELSISYRLKVMLLDLTSASLIQSTSSHSLPVRWILLLASHLRVCLPSGFLPWVSRPKFRINFSFSLATCPSFSFAFKFHPNKIISKSKVVNSSLCLTKYHAMKTYCGGGSTATRIPWPRH